MKQPDRHTTTPVSPTLLACLMLAALALQPTTIPAGTLSSGVQRAIAAKATRHSTAKLNQRQAEQQSAQALTQAEQAALRRELARLDTKTLRALERRYGTHIPPARLAEARIRVTEFRDHASYQRRLKETYPDLPKGQREGVVGDYKGKPYVDQNQATLPRTVGHERIHQLADPRFRTQAGSRLDEGMTEHLASRISGDLAIPALPRAYPNEHRVIGMLGARVGEERLVRAYFRGDVARLRKDLDSQLGRGAFDQVAVSVERGQYHIAEDILKHGLR